MRIHATRHGCLGSVLLLSFLLLSSPLPLDDERIDGEDVIMAMLHHENRQTWNVHRHATNDRVSARPGPLPGVDEMVEKSGTTTLRPGKHSFTVNFIEGPTDETSGIISLVVCLFIGSPCAPATPAPAPATPVPVPAFVPAPSSLWPSNGPATGLSTMSIHRLSFHNGVCARVCDETALLDYTLHLLQPLCRQLVAFNQRRAELCNWLPSADRIGVPSDRGCPRQG